MTGREIDVSRSYGSIHQHTPHRNSDSSFHVTRTLRLFRVNSSWHLTSRASGVRPHTLVAASSRLRTAGRTQYKSNMGLVQSRQLMKATIGGWGRGEGGQRACQRACQHMFQRIYSKNRRPFSFLKTNNFGLLLMINNFLKRIFKSSPWGIRLA